MFSMVGLVILSFKRDLAGVNFFWPISPLTVARVHTTLLSSFCHMRLISLAFRYSFDI